MAKTISFRFKNTPEDQAFAKALLEGERSRTVSDWLEGLSDESLDKRVNFSR